MHFVKSFFFFQQLILINENKKGCNDVNIWQHEYFGCVGAKWGGDSSRIGRMSAQKQQAWDQLCGYGTRFLVQE